MTQKAPESPLLRPIRKTRAYEEIVRQVQSLIEGGSLRPGERLPTERDLADQFGVSRVTVRQAMSVLQAMGLIDSRVGDGTFARHQGPTVAALGSMIHPRTTLLEQLELRRLIEPQVARLAATRAGEAQIAEYDTHLEAQRQKMQEGIPFVEEDSALHLAIARSSGNTLLVRMMEGIHQSLWTSREHSLRTRSAMESSFAGHLKIVQAIGRHDERAAQRAMLNHVRQVEAIITQGDKIR
ncbi:MAG: FadR family transcriptional regulator [Acidimicrobiaceae bacterium]|nr:FadR family transcriptional regulator [Acidimicrobiaceae bacterium]